MDNGMERLQEYAKQVRVDTLRMTHAAGSGHPGGSFSMAEFLVALYHRRLQNGPDTNDDPNRDVAILSKGHCAPGLYAVLAQRGFIDAAEFPRLRRLGGQLQGHADRKIPGIEMSTGSLGMGLGYGNGVALSKRLRGHSGKVFVILGDGELQEGNIWESAMTSAHRKLGNLICIIDHNKIQIDGHCEDVKGIAPVGEKFRAFGFHVIEAAGHDVTACVEAYAAADAWQEQHDQPVCIVFDTVKGHGVSFMADKAEFHGRALNDEEMQAAMEELGAAWP